MPTNWFRWDANATFSRNRVKNMQVTLDDYTTVVDLGTKPLSFSPDIIFNNILTFNYKGFEAKVVERFVGEQYLTNTGFKKMQCKDADGKTTMQSLDHRSLARLPLLMEALWTEGRHDRLYGLQPLQQEV